MKQLKIARVSNLIAFVLCVLFSIAGILVSLHRYWQFEIWYYDFGIFDQAIWKVAHFIPPAIDHFIVSQKLIFADHFHPSIFLLSPLYWFTNRSEVLLIAQALLVGVSAFVLYLLSVQVIKHRLISLAILISYLLFTGLQNAVITEFHELALVPLPLMLTYWGILQKKKRLFLISFIITLGFKETLFLLGIGLSIFVFFYRKEWRKLSLFTLLYSLLWGFLTIKIIIPYFSGGIYQYAFNESFSITHIVQQLISPAIKLKTVFWIFGSFLFLPFLSLSTLPIILMNLASRFVTPGATRWDLGFHYNAEIAPTLAIATLLAFNFLRKRVSQNMLRVLAVLLTLNAVFLYRFILHGPFALAYNPAFYNHTKNFQFLEQLINKVPKDATVMTQNNLAARFTHQQVYLLRENYQQYAPEYIVFDVREGQNPNNFLGVEDAVQILENVQNDETYQILFHEGNQYIFKTKIR